MIKHKSVLVPLFFFALSIAFPFGSNRGDKKIEKKHLTLERLYSSPRLWGTSPTNIIWSQNSSHIAFLWNDKGERFKDAWFYTLGEDLPRKLTDMKSVKPRLPESGLRTEEEKQREERLATGINSLVWSPDNRHILFSYIGDLFMVDINGRELRRLTDTKAGEGEIEFSPDGRFVSFTRGGDIWLLNLSDCSLRQLTQSGSSNATNGSYQWSSDSTKISFIFTDSTKVSDIIIPDYMGDRVSVAHERRSYTGEFDLVLKVGVTSVNSGKTVWADLGKDNNFYIGGIRWSPDNRYILIDKLTLDEKHRWLLVFSVEDGTTKEVYHEEDVMNFFTSRYADWSKDGKGIFFISDKDQYYHLYCLPLEFRSLQQLTRGQWEIIWMEMSKNGNDIFYLSTKDSPAERHLYRYDILKASSTKITEDPGVYNPTVSSEGDFSALLYSNDITPPDLYIKDNKTSTPMKRITFSPMTDFGDYQWLPARYVTFKSHKDGVILHGRLITPHDLEPNKKYPAILGPVYNNTVRNQWVDRSPFTQYLVQEKKYVQLLVDCRGSTGYGRLFRQEIVCARGERELDDLVSGVEYLKSLGYVDASRIGIWGWSGGGFLTMMAMFKYPGTFAVGIAGAGNVLWNYDTTWTMRIMGSPKENPDAYKNLSPLYHAHKLQGKLLLVHGVMDNRVLFQETVQIIQKLIMAKKDYDLIIAPRGGHGWDPIDEAQLFLYRHMAEYFQRYLGTGHNGEDK
jgi:dipeptidyl-peptidase-4